MGTAGWHAVAPHPGFADGAPTRAGGGAVVLGPWAEGRPGARGGPGSVGPGPRGGPGSVGPGPRGGPGSLSGPRARPPRRAGRCRP
ncbi:hypothetical protein FJ693_02735 [Georgenia yuyongxinii]|uniref:Uncharacterized protein n=1 Tax=Georgenia yuyongxinii TaxID=2589797 RepID=A0A552WWJ6_9MICO|nr:hypothetical protein FJ693_02735 [Georgenia yuyongxinii]